MTTKSRSFHRPTSSTSRERCRSYDEFNFFLPLYFERSLSQVAKYHISSNRLPKPACISGSFYMYLGTQTVGILGHLSFLRLNWDVCPVYHKDKWLKCSHLCGNFRSKSQLPSHTNLVLSFHPLSSVFRVLFFKCEAKIHMSLQA